MMKISENMSIAILDSRGNDLVVFKIPEEFKDGDVLSDEDAMEFGHKMVKAYFDVKREMEEFERKLLDNCDCFWKDRLEEERCINRCHSSECATWTMK